MKRVGLVILAIMLTAVLLAGCGASMSEETTGLDYQSKNSGANYDMDISEVSAPVPDVMANESPEIAGDGAGYYEEGRKAIKTGEAQLEVVSFDSAFETIKTMLGTNGYIEESNIWKTPTYYNGEQIMLTNGNVRLRIKQEAFQGFTDGLATIGTILTSRTYEDDISDMYYDTEARLGLLRDEKERLEQYADNVEDPEIFFETQSRITQVIYDMESLQGSLKKWDSKVEYSTVYITINEKNPGEESAVSAPKGFFDKIWDNMKDSVEFLGRVVIVLFGILPVIFVITVVVVVLVIIVKKTAGKKTPPDKK